MKTENRPDFEKLPVFDMRDLFSHEREAFLIELREACHHVGFFYIKNHGIPLAKMEQMLELSADFFNLPQEKKDAIHITKSPHYRGYGNLGAEKTLGKRDYKETLDFGLEQIARDVPEDKPYFILQGPNQWPELLNFKKNILEYISAMQLIGQQLISALAEGLGLVPNHFEKYFSSADDSYAILRLLRYPPAKKLELGVGPHTDFGCLVMLLQDETGGLQVQNCKGQWVDAPPIPGTFVVNIGEMLQVWSNNYFLATPHRVINQTEKIRHSVPFFFEPNLTTCVSPLEISSSLLNNMSRPKADPQVKKIYGEHILKVYERSF